ncbi:LysM domain-containing protein [Arthrobacter sp. B0490]|uniref:LysM peptidoglycan-binding domain-containing protein n=1 Tax=Arthrobacter sp. B0490 TaxID=2058891 RepID=UPI000CE50BF8|nr:LysM domain-containing protein [Arthrobacter sp. B0490]
MSRKISSARHRAAIDGNLALQGLSRAAKAHATMVGRPVAVVAVTSGLALSVVGTAHAGTSTEQGTTPAPAAVAAPAAPAVQAAPAAPAAAADATHTVVAGDTLGGISAGYGADLTAVLAANGLSLASIIFPGDSIVIPTGGAVTAQTVSVPVAVAPAAPMQQAAVVAPAPVVQQAAAVAPAPVVQQAPVVAPAPAPAVSEAPGSGVYLASAEVTPAAASGGGATLLASAQGQLAAGAVQDCTVLVENALHAAGIAAGDLGPSQFFQYGATVATPAPGDIVITGGHVAIYAGGGQVISSGMNGSNLTMQHPLSDLPGASFVRV